MKALVDAQLPPRLAGWLRGRGVDAVHVEDIGLLDAEDEAIWVRALAESRVLITKDRDFADWAIARTPWAQVVWLRGGNQRTAAILAALADAWSQVEEGLAGGARVIEVGR